MFKDRDFCDPYFPVFGLHTGKYGPEKTPYLKTFHAVILVEPDTLVSGLIVVISSINM